jgi:hypothetical protein
MCFLGLRQTALLSAEGKYTFPRVSNDTCTTFLRLCCCWSLHFGLFSRNALGIGRQGASVDDVAIAMHTQPARMHTWVRQSKNLRQVVLSLQLLA